MIKSFILLFFLIVTAAQAQTASITVTQSSLVYSARNRVDAVPNSNSVYIDQQNNYGTINIDQYGQHNKITGINFDPLIILGDNNSLTIKQGDPSDPIGKNLTEVRITGYNNQINILQAINVNTGLRDGDESSGHYAVLNLSGNLNNIDLRQANAGGINSGHYMNIDIIGNTNNLLIKQKSNTEKVIFGSIVGDQNLVNIDQQGHGDMFMNFSLVGNNHSLITQQKNNGAHQLDIILINSGGHVAAEIIQQGNTPKNLSLYQNCTNPIGCTVNIFQSNP